MLVLMNTTTSHQYGHNADYDFAVVKLEQFEANIISRYLSLFDTLRKSEPRGIELTYNGKDIECEFYPCQIWDADEMDVMPEELRADLDAKGWAIIPDELELPFTPKDAHAPDTIFFRVNEDSFWWHTIPLDEDITIDTEPLPREILAQII